MISYIRGSLSEINNSTIVVENAGFGINIKVPENLIFQLPPLGELVKIYTYMYVREDAINLFGFLERKDLELFKMLISVSSVGPVAGLSLLSSIDANSLREYIVSSDVASISKAKGIGKKTAERIVLELKDRIVKEGTIFASTTDVNNKVVEETLAALETLGISRTQASKIIASVDTSEITTEELIKKVLKEMA